MRGVAFRIRNAHGKPLYDIMRSIADPSWYWSIDLVESYQVENGERTVPLFQETIMDGRSFLDHIANSASYLIFVDLKAFPTKESIVEVKVFEDYMGSDCQCSLIVIDSSYVWILAKDQQLIHSLYERAKTNGYTQIEYIPEEDDLNTILNVWG